jgi:hypothetical protein
MFALPSQIALQLAREHAADQHRRAARHRPAPPESPRFQSSPRLEPTGSAIEAHHSSTPLVTAGLVTAGSG